jgi:hypothetical protein
LQDLLTGEIKCGIQKEVGLITGVAVNSVKTSVRDLGWKALPTFLWTAGTITRNIAKLKHLSFIGSQIKLLIKHKTLYTLYPILSGLFVQQISGSFSEISGFSGKLCGIIAVGIITVCLI